jgi:hypothetical protein
MALILVAVANIGVTSVARFLSPGSRDSDAMSAFGGLLDRRDDPMHRDRIGDSARSI